MKIGHFMPGLKHPGGIGSYIGRIAKAQQRLGHDILLFDRIGIAPVEDQREILLTRDDSDLFIMAQDCAVDILHLHTVVARSHGSVKTIRTMHGHWPYCPSGSRFLKRQGVACERAYSLLGCGWGHIIDRCGSVRPAQFSAGFNRTWVEKKTLPDTRVLAISEFVKSQMIRSGYPGDDIYTLYLPAPEVLVDDPIALTQASPRQPSFLFLGRLVKEKGVEWLLRAAANVKGEFTLEIAGEGPDRERLESLAARLGLGDRTCFHGWLREPDALELIARSRAVIFPSIWHEPAGLVTLEAASRGRAVIASRVGGIPEYAEKLGNAILVDPSDIPGLTAAMQRLLDDPLEASHLGEQGRRMAEHSLSLQQHVQALQHHYDEVRNQKTTIGSI